MRVLITGGAGFIGCSAGAKHLRRGDAVLVFDNLSRAGANRNLQWLQDEVCPQSEGGLEFVQGDICNGEAVRTAVERFAPDLILHLAAQVAVTTSIQNPRQDFDINALGSFLVLEAARLSENPPAVFFASTNKVYGGMEASRTAIVDGRYRDLDNPQGVSERYPLDFHSPYGCSKGCADQYFRDYARIYGLRTVVFRQSCIYGRRQFGVEDQGWVAHFLIAAALGRPITIYGDGMQVRDLLNVDDLLAAYDAAYERIDVASGEVFNVGGGVENSLAIWSEFGPIIEELAQRPLNVRYAEWRKGDQPVYISDNHKAIEVLGWQPQVAVRDGIRDLWQWITANPHLFA